MSTVSNLNNVQSLQVWEKLKRQKNTSTLTQVFTHHPPLNLSFESRSRGSRLQFMSNAISRLQFRSNTIIQLQLMSNTIHPTAVPAYFKWVTVYLISVLLHVPERIFVRIHDDEFEIVKDDVCSDVDVTCHVVLRHLALVHRLSRLRNTTALQEFASDCT